MTTEAAEFRSGAVGLFPLGGLGEIGLNCLAVEYEGQILVIDAGLMFPDASTMPGVDLVIPDFRWLAERADKISAVVFTHGHEDHIGAAGFLMRQLKDQTPIYATALTLALASERLAEAKVDKPNLIEIKPRQSLRAGPFDLEFIRVNHSIVDGVAVAVNTPFGAVVHTGDFKIDQANSDERIDLYKFAQYGEKGVLALLSDSTNAELPGSTESETEVGRSLEQIFRQAPGRVIVTCFASSLTRIKQVARAAAAVGRKIIFDGRGMVNIVRLAKTMGYLNLAEEAEISLADSSLLPDSQLVIVATGSQGEPMSALARMAHGDHRQVSVKAGDTIIISARIIAGHEKAISQLIDLFYRQGAKVLDDRRLKVHTSGHAQAEELKLMLNLTRPRNFIPIHGETRHLLRHAELARSLGWREDQVWLLHNGQSLWLNPDGSAQLGQSVPSGRKLVDGSRLGEPADPVLRSRLKLAGAGLVVVTVVLTDEGSLAARPLVNISGVHYENEVDLSLEAEALSVSLTEQWRREGGLDTNILAAEIQKGLRQLFRSSISRRPSVWPQVIVLPKRPPQEEDHG